MDEPNEPGPEQEPEERQSPDGVPVAIAATQDPVELEVALVPDERTPDGMVCMGTYRNGRLIARCVLPPEAWAELEEFEVFAEPVSVVLVAQEAPPGLQCRLFAMIELPETEGEDEEDEAEPWAASVPSSGYEAAVSEESEDEEDAEARIVPLPLGNIVRYAADRVHPESLPQEAADVLQKVIEGRTSEVVDRALADLFRL